VNDFFHFDVGALSILVESVKGFLEAFLVDIVVLRGYVLAVVWLRAFALLALEHGLVRVVGYFDAMALHDLLITPILRVLHVVVLIVYVITGWTFAFAVRIAVESFDGKFALRRRLKHHVY
jgi:hypothetical protein